MKNTTPLSRRQLLTASAAAITGMAMHDSFGAVAPKQAGSGDPITPQLKLSCAAYSYRAYLPRNEKKGVITLFDWLELAAGWGLDGVELTSYYFTSEDRKYLNDMKAKAFKLGLDVSGTSVGNNFCLTEKEDWEKQIADVKRWIDNSVILGSPCMRVFAGGKPKKGAREEHFKQVVEALKICADYAGEKGVFLALENHGYLTETATEVLAILDAVNHEWLGVNLDTGNFVADPYTSMARVMPKTLTAHVKAFVRTEKGDGREPADYTRILALFREHNYRGYVSLEYEADEDAKTGVPKYLAMIRAAMTA